jgi:PKD repeat protein
MFSAAPTSGDAPLAVAFSDDSTGLPTSWSWIFGDGAVSSLENPIHTYANAGHYTVSLTVHNSGPGATTLTRSAFVEVLAPVSDLDGDFIPDADDNCPFTPNPDQADNDADGIGNVCDPTPDGGGGTPPGICDAVSVEHPGPPLNFPVVQVTGASGTGSVCRDGWGAYFVIDLTDTSADGHCVYAEVRLTVTDGTDPDARVGTVCGAGVTTRLYNNLRARHDIGSAITTAEIKICTESRFRDPCAKSGSLVLPQHTALGTDARIAEMIGIMGTSLDDFYAAKARGGGGYDWTDNGCSVPGGLRRFFVWADFFLRACARHDWGYYNFGQSSQAGQTTWFEATDTRRNYIDDNFIKDMTILCSSLHDPRLCLARASEFWGGVHYGGGYGFYE